MPTRTSNSPQAKVADDLDPFHGFDVRVEIAHPHPVLGEILGQVLGHPLGQHGDEDPLSHGGAAVDLSEHIVDLGDGGTHLHPGVHEPRGPHELLHHPSGSLRLVGARGRRHEHCLGRDGLELVEPERPVVERRGKSEAVAHQGLLARTVPPVHRAELGHGDVALVDDEERLRRQVVEQGGRRLPGRPPRKVARIVLDPLAMPDLLEHFQIEAGTLLEALRLHQLLLGP